jgi:hypothetical protein
MLMAYYQQWQQHEIIRQAEICMKGALEMALHQLGRNRSVPPVWAKIVRGPTELYTYLALSNSASI